MADVAPPSQLPRAPGVRDGLRLTAARLRTRGRVEVRGAATVGRGVRFDVAPGARLVLGEDVQVGAGCRFHVRAGEVRLGAGAVLGPRCAVVCHTEVDVGAGCVLGDEVVLTDVRPPAGRAGAPLRAEGPRPAAVRVGDGARLGPGAVVEGGGSVRAGAAVGAHGVVRAAGA